MPQTLKKVAETHKKLFDAHEFDKRIALAMREATKTSVQSRVTQLETHRGYPGNG